MLIRKAEAISKGERLELKHDWVPYEKISPDVVCAVIESEDSHFYEHGGFSYNDMLDAFCLNKRMGRIVAGGSTISQQTAKNVFCTPARTYTRKLIEASVLNQQPKSTMGLLLSILIIDRLIA